MNQFRRVIALSVICVLLLMSVNVSAESVSGIWNAWNGDGNEEFTADITVQFSAHMPFDEERREALNALLKHITLRLSDTGDVQQTEILVDGDPALSLMTRGEGEEQNTVCSFLPGTTVIGKDAGINLSDISSVDLASDFELLQRSGKAILTDLYDWLIRLPELCPDNCKNGKEKQSFKNVGKAVTKTVITFTKASVEEGVLDVWKEACPAGELKTWAQDLVFSGRQQITLFRDDQDRVIRLTYSGTAAMGDAVPRKITLGWSRLRTAEKSYDKLSLKTPAVSGSDHDTVTLEFLESFREDGSAVSLDFSVEHVENRVKRSAGCVAELSLAESSLTGSITLKQKEGNGTQQFYILTPKFFVGENGAMNGTVVYQQKRGKDLLEDAEITAELTRNATLPDFPETTLVIQESSMNDEEKASLRDQILWGAAEALIRPVLSLPEEDLQYLLYELDEDQVKLLKETINLESSERSAS